MADKPQKKPKNRTEAARLLLKKAQKQSALAKAGMQMGSDDVTVTFLFQAYENAVRAAAKVTGEFAETPKHWDLSEQARELAEQGYLKTDASDRLDELNRGRKSAAYGYEEEFEHSDFDKVLDEIDEFIAEVDHLINRGGKRFKGPEDENA